MKAIKCISVAALGVLCSTLTSLACAQSFDQLKNDTKSTGDVLTYGMGYGQQRYSPLNKVNKNTVRNLVPVWNLSLDNATNASTQPLVVNGVILVASHNATTAIDGVTGRQKWKVPIELPNDVNGFLCCGIHTRGLAVFDGLIYRTTIDAHVMAINVSDGKTVWKSKAAEYKEGYSMTRAPLVAGGVLITGISGGEYGTRGFLNGWDPEDRQGTVDALHHPRTRRARPRHLEARGVQTRRRAHVDHRQL